MRHVARSSGPGSVVATSREIVCKARMPGAPFAHLVPQWLDLSRSEREHCAAGFPRLDRYAGRLAAKHAVQRLVGPRKGHPPLTDVEIGRTVDGRPLVMLHGAALASAHERGFAAETIDVSISHRSGRGIAIAAAPWPGSGSRDRAVEVGIDLTERAAIASAVDRWGPRLGALVLTENERSGGHYATDPVDAVIVGIATKEAIGKVLKRDWPDVSWHDVEVVPLAIEHPPEPIGHLADQLARGLALHRVHLGCTRTTFVAPSPHISDVSVAWGHARGWTYALAARSVSTRRARMAS